VTLTTGAQRKFQPSTSTWQTR